MGAGIPSTYVLFGTPSPFETATVPGAPRVVVAIVVLGVEIVGYVGGELSSPQKFTKLTLEVGAVRSSPHCRLNHALGHFHARHLQEEFS